MQTEQLTQYSEYLLGLALKKCGNIYDAEDLTQETLLAAISYISKGKEIKDFKTWLCSVMNRRFNDALRKKYNHPVIHIGDDFDIMDDSNILDNLEQESEYEAVRKAVAYLGKTYRDVLVRHYLRDQSIEQISKELGIPKGTVKSRLHLGRKSVKEGLENMEKYNEQSYSPVRLNISYSGTGGINGEPCSIVYNDVLAQNILWLAYEKPVTMEEISLGLGVPIAYIEPVVEKLVNGELMVKTGIRYYTDFIIYTVDDMKKHIPAQIEFVNSNFDMLWTPIEEAITTLNAAFSTRSWNMDTRNSMELYTAFNCLDYGIFEAVTNAFNSQQEFPDRPSGGRWIAFGHIIKEGYVGSKDIGLRKYEYSGERNVRLDNISNNDSVEMHVYGTEGFPCCQYDRSPDYTFIPKKPIVDEEFSRLLYAIYKEVNPESAGLNHEYLKAIPWLTRCKVLRKEGYKILVNIPVLSQNEAHILREALYNAHVKLAGSLAEPLSVFLKGKRKEIPPHLRSVPLQKQYLYSYDAMVLATIREAIRIGKLHDGKYDEENQPPCPMVLVVHDEELLNFQKTTNT